MELRGKRRASPILNGAQIRWRPGGGGQSCRRRGLVWCMHLAVVLAGPARARHGAARALLAATRRRHRAARCEQPRPEVCWWWSVRPPERRAFLAARRRRPGTPAVLKISRINVSIFMPHTFVFRCVERGMWLLANGPEPYYCAAIFCSQTHRELFPTITPTAADNPLDFANTPGPSYLFSPGSQPRPRPWRPSRLPRRRSGC